LRPAPGYNNNNNSSSNNDDINYAFQLMMS